MSIERMMTNKSDYKEKEADPKLAPGCVDGRMDPKVEVAPQMLGGSIHPIVTAAIFFNRVFDSDYVTEQATSLQEAGYKLGVHRGSHKKPDENKSDCGASDNLAVIIDKAKAMGEEIKGRLMAVHKENVDTLEVTSKDFEEGVDKALNKINEYDTDNIKISGDELVSHFESMGAHVMDLEEDHAENGALVNFKKGVTNDTNAANECGDPNFNLDVPVLVEQAGVLGVDEGFATYLALILYIATEMVLVEDKGKEALPVLVHS